MSDFRLASFWFFLVLSSAFIVDYSIGDHLVWDDAIVAFMLMLLSSIVMGSTCFLLCLRLRALWCGLRATRTSMDIKGRHEFNT